VAATALSRAVTEEDRLHVAGLFEPVPKLSRKVGHEEPDPSSIYA
jgi:hypothetical protein